jgi:hypothetical protein
MNKILTFTLLFLSLAHLDVFSQNYTNFIVTPKKDTVFCNIKKIELGNIYYQKSNSDSKTELSEISLDDVLDFKGNDDLIVENYYNRTLRTPAKGKSLIYIYRTSNIVNMLVGFNINYKGEKLIRLKNSSFFVHEVEPGIHSYSTSAWASSFDDINISTKEGEVYFIQVDQTGGVFIGGNAQFGRPSSGGVDFMIFQRSKNVGEALWKSIRKELSKK